MEMTAIFILTNMGKDPWSIQEAFENVHRAAEEAKNTP